MRHPLINNNSMQVDYESELPWNPTRRLSEVVKKVQAKLTQTTPTYDSELDKAVQQLDNYSRQL
jgi:DNA-directed RNA polymerase subunit L